MRDKAGCREVMSANQRERLSTEAGIQDSWSSFLAITSVNDVLY